jgi:hypothetical protein
MQVYAAPLLSEGQGSSTLSCNNKVKRSLECLAHCSEQRPAHAPTVARIIHLVHTAHRVYLHETNLATVCPPTIGPQPVEANTIQAFIEELQAFSHDIPGEQVLIWATFIMASSCESYEHRLFFEQFFSKHHVRNGFGNLRQALWHLQRIWSRPPGQRWSRMLPDTAAFVM